MTDRERDLHKRIESLIEQLEAAQDQNLSLRALLLMILGLEPNAAIECAIGPAPAKLPIELAAK